MKRIVHKHPLAIRWFHWVNFPVLFVMIWSGLLIYWAYDPYKIQIGDYTLVSFFPDGFYKFLGVSRRLAEGMAWHFVFMWLFILNGVLYVGYTFISGEWRHLVPDRNSFREAIQVTLYDLGLRKTQPPFIKYNGAQKIAYFAIMLMGIGSVLTGYAIYKPTQFSWLTSLVGGYKAARLEHFILTLGYVFFFVIHIGQVIRAGWNNFQSMVTGFEIVQPTDPDRPVLDKPASNEPDAPTDTPLEPIEPTRNPALS
ncbi:MULTISPECIES: cytochrome b/b6 domain-containing protein [unclassified Spirosoma]|uniref:cytochrome b/b6 domain-containing protein n=1 Tax=unclassified Spirosoma TaxID=2621999 RepID=UPI0009590C28|nr:MULTISPECIES: cytochrome b/b6 domain-containing protein [unclassified Spirosoma]MBN8821944.1 cytochrome b/b6 domain-containing protein [Spirosoma sp.]OJW80581.1 MAG: thiosulfate reductase [Spirosoma sp. 48-14]